MVHNYHWMLKRYCIQGNIWHCFYAPFALAVWANLRLVKHNCIWENSRRGETVCEYRRAKLPEAKITLFTVILISYRQQTFLCLTLVSLFSLSWTPLNCYVHIRNQRATNDLCILRYWINGLHVQTTGVFRPNRCGNCWALLKLLEITRKMTDFFPLLN